MASGSSRVPAISHPTIDTSVASSTAASSQQQQQMESAPRKSERLARPSLGTRKSSGTLIIPRDSPVVEVHEEQYDEGDARAMSPRRGSKEIARMGEDARAALEEQASLLQSHLLEIIERVDSVRDEHEKIEGGNRFLQSYIGELITTSKITTATSSKPKKGRNAK